MQKIIVVGACGRMGKKVIEAIDKDPNFEVAALVDKGSSTPVVLKSCEEFSGSATCIIDFSHHSSVAEVCKCAIDNSIPIVLATTGHTPEEEEIILDASKSVAIFKSANMSIGVGLTCELAKQVATKFDSADCEIVETHHNKKLDAPSGTALMLAESVRSARGSGDFVKGRSGMEARRQGEIGIQAIRRGNVVGIHSVIFDNGNEVVEIKHTATDRSLFAEGSLRAAEYLFDKEPGIYRMEDYICS